MPEIDELALWYALNRLMTDYWADVDHNGGNRAHEFYLPDALYAVGNNHFDGVEKISRVLRPAPPVRQQHHPSSGRQCAGVLR